MELAAADRSTGIKAGYARWNRDRVIAWAFMPRHRSSSPTRRSHGESSGGLGGERDGGGLVIHRVTKEISSSGNFPTLTRTNYYDWVALMHVMRQARGLWPPVMLGTDDVTEDRMALEVLSKAVPAEMMGTIASKPSAKAAWEAIKVMNVGVERVRKAKAGMLRWEFDSLKFRDRETVDDFGIRIGRIVTQLTVLGDAIKEEQVVHKFLQALPPRFEQIASSIKTLLDLSDVSVEELIAVAVAARVAVARAAAVRNAGRSRHRQAARGAMGAAAAVGAAAAADPAPMAGTSPAMSAGTAARKGTGPASAARRKGMRRPTQPRRRRGRRTRPCWWPRRRSISDLPLLPQRRRVGSRRRSTSTKASSSSSSATRRRGTARNGSWIREPRIT
ncbi:hypothetical protein U9M48_027954 [Paspalum notatum var. saurae]|uniref:Uncharacterized protein n=1 Tax=Paspalum notatum var. saurae TaxID=547442 RepID=A0AAQ3TXE2_PASNO